MSFPFPERGEKLWKGTARGGEGAQARRELGEISIKRAQASRLSLFHYFQYEYIDHVK